MTNFLSKNCCIGAGLFMRVAVCEGECEDAEQIVSMLQSIYSESGRQVTVSWYFDFVSLLRDAADGAFSLILYSPPESLDELSENMDELWSTGYMGGVILMSCDVRTAYFGYSVGASGVISKPFYRDSVAAALKNAVRQRRGVMTFPSGSELVNIALDDITYIESERSCCTVHTSKGSYTTADSLDRIADRLGECFVRCHRSFIVNLEYIASIGSELLLSTGEKILVRRKSLKDLRSRLISYRSRRQG